MTAGPGSRPRRTRAAPRNRRHIGDSRECAWNKPCRGDRQSGYNALLISERIKRLRWGREVVVRAVGRCRPARTPGVPPFCNGAVSVHRMECVSGGSTGWIGRLGPFAMRRSGVRIPSAPPMRTGPDLRKRGSGPGFACLAGVPPAYPCNVCNWCNKNETVSRGSETTPSPCTTRQSRSPRACVARAIAHPKETVTCAQWP